MSKINYTRSSIFGTITAEGIDSLIVSKNKLNRIKDAMDQQIGSPADYTKLQAADFGVAAGDEQLFYNTVSALCASLNAIFIGNIAGLDKGG